MLRSMYSGISGMKNFQTKLDTIGNNIANVNTSGFKKGRVTFQDMMSQTLSNAQGAVAGVRGGLNATQVGLGSQLGSIDNIQTQGNRQTTDRTLDLALEGDGMFVLGSNLNAGNIDMEASDVNFTRSGNFYLDNEGYIVNTDGLYLLGEGSAAGALNGQLSQIQIPANAASFSIADNGTVNYVDGNGNTQIAGQIRLASFSNPGGLERSGSNLYRITANAGAFEDVAGDGFNALNDLVIPGAQGSASIVSGALEMSNVDLAEEFTEMITAQRAFQSNTKIITTSDEILQELVNLKR